LLDEVLSGGKLKETGLEHCAALNKGATNSSSFTALPGGGIANDGSFYGLSLSSKFWSATKFNEKQARLHSLGFNSVDLGWSVAEKEY